MNAELQETLELVRTVKRGANEIVTFSEHHCATPAVIRAAKRVRQGLHEGLIDVLRKATGELGDPKDSRKFHRFLERGEVPPHEISRSKAK